MPCRGCDREVRLIDAHIVPRGLANITRGDQHNVILSPEARRETPQLGDVDRHILCGPCDARLGLFDECLIEVCRNYPRLERNCGQYFELPTVDADSFA